ncbi:MAG TPA: ABC transporter permease, partial [Marmoricola sp.]
MTVAIGAADGAVAAAEGGRGPRHHGFGRYAGAKLAGALGSLMFMLVVNFFLFRVLPGDPARTLGRGRLSTPEQLAEFNATYGLDQSLGQQFVTFLKNLAHGDLGYSILYHRDVSSILLDRLWPTLLLVGTSTVLAASLGIWLGVRAGWSRGSRFDRFSTSGSLTLYSMPEWWLGLLLIAILAVGVGPLPGIFPTGGLHSV